MNHNHPDPLTLTSGCDGCIERVRHDQERAEYMSVLPALTDEQLVEHLMGREHILNDWKAAALTNEIARREAKAS